MMKMMRELQFARMFCDSDRLEGISLEICVPNFSEIPDHDTREQMKVDWCSQHCSPMAYYIEDKGGEIFSYRPVTEFTPEADLHDYDDEDDDDGGAYDSGPPLAVSPEEYREIQLSAMAEEKFALGDGTPVIDATFTDPQFEKRKAIGDLIDEMKDNFPLVVVRLLLPVDYYRRNKKHWPHVVDFTSGPLVLHDSYEDFVADGMPHHITGAYPRPDMRPSLNN